MSRARNLLTAGAIAGFLTVALGAFGAHALKQQLSPDMLNIYHKAVQYQGLHALALLATALLYRDHPQPNLRWAGRFFVLGMILFCGSLYLLAITQTRGLGLLTPLGGLSFLTGWALLGMGCWKLDQTR